MATSDSRRDHAQPEPDASAGHTEEYAHQHAPDADSVEELPADDPDRSAATTREDRPERWLRKHRLGVSS